MPWHIGLKRTNAVLVGNIIYKNKQMELIKFIKLQLHLKDKNSSYQNRVLAALGLDIKLEDIDNITDAEFERGLKAGVELIKYDTIPSSYQFTFNDKEYKVLQANEIKTKHWIDIEFILTEFSQEIPKSYISLMKVLTETQDDFKELDHKIALPYISFFLTILTRFDQNTRAYIQLRKTIETMESMEDQASVDLKKNLIEFTEHLINF